MRSIFMVATLVGLAMTPLCLAQSPQSEAQKYKLRYKFKKGETLSWKVDHRATTETTIKGNTQTSTSRSVSTKQWFVKDVAANGQAIFVHSVADVDMWQEVSGRPKIHYNSKTDETPPPAYLAVAETVGVPMFVVTVDSIGRLLQREAKNQQAERAQIGLEQMTIPMPNEAVKVGTRWHVPSQISIRLQDGRLKPFKIRRIYQLTKVQTGVATIDVKTEVLTPINDSKEKLDLMQRMNEGTVRFDIDAGRILSKEMQWDETVVNFNGADSKIQYLARFTESWLGSAQATAQRPPAATKPAGPPLQR